MCGIFGLYTKETKESSSYYISRLAAAQNALSRRGPDSAGLQTITTNGINERNRSILHLGHTRLSIIELSASGNQPMSSNDGRYIIIFNGEIYNYRELRAEHQQAGIKFTTESDTEVLLNTWIRWGKDGLRRLVGMFAFAIYDSTESKLTLVRDAFGIKPLLYHEETNQICFASEISALIELSEQKPGLNLKQSYLYLQFGHYDQGEQTFLEGVKYLPSAHLVSLDLRTGKLGQPERWWRPSIEERKDLSFKDAADQLRELFLNSVKLHLRSDVRIGAALSGGIDSSAIACAMRYLEPDMPIHTFTYIAQSSSINEARWANIVNKHISAIPHQVIISPNEFANDIEDLISYQGEPFGSTSIYAQYRVFKAARQAGITVTLEGQGADEIFAGYDGYPLSYINSLMENRKYSDILRFILGWTKWPRRRAFDGIKTLLSASLPTSIKQSLVELLTEKNIPNWIYREKFSDQYILSATPKSSIREKDGTRRRLVEQLRFDLTRGGILPLLRHGDRNSMRWSVESRVPFLTIDIVEFVLRLPEDYLLSPNGQTKRIFREAMRGLVPDEIIERPDKVGFETPQRLMLVETNESIRNSAPSTPTIDWINSKIYREALNRYLSNDRIFESKCWRMINFSKWVEQCDF
jgi:asparagine synthase (glutamine-hydrolysing)